MKKILSRFSKMIITVIVYFPNDFFLKILYMCIIYIFWENIFEERLNDSVYHFNENANF